MAGEILLSSSKVTYDISPAIVSADFELSVEGPSTQTFVVGDRSRALLRSGLFDSDRDGRLNSDVRLDDGGIIYRVANLSRDQAGSFTIILEDEAVSRLREVKGVKRPSSSTGHVDFARALCREAGVELRGLEGVTLIPPTNSAIRARERQEDRDSKYSRGISSGANLTVKGKQATGSQKRIAETALARAAYRKAGPKATLALMMALIVESEITNLGWSDGANKSRGVLQARPGVSAGVGGKTVTVEQSNDVEYMVDCFLLDPGFASRGGAISLAKKNPSWTAGTIAWNVEMPATQYRSRYDGVRSEAQSWIAAFGGVEPSAEPKTVGSTPFRGAGETSWDALKRVAEERGYRVFSVANTIYYGREQDLIRSRPVADVSVSIDSVEGISWEWMPGKKVNSVTLVVRASMWAVKPGSVILVEGEGPADGRYLVSRFTRSRFSEVATVECRRGTELMKPGGSAGSSGSKTILAGGGEGSLKNTYKGSPVPGLRPAASSDHDTGNLPGFRAHDFMARAGTPCVAPESGTIYKLSGKDPKLGGPSGGALGYSIYLAGVSGTKYFMTHLDKVRVKVGQKVTQGEQIAEVANGPASWSSPHVHMGMNPIWKNWNR